MKKTRSKSTAPDEARKKRVGFPGAGEGDSERLQHLINDLRIHQVELEMQNEELNRTREELEEALERYTDLYDFAPVGYFTLSHEAIIRAVNLTGAELLQSVRSRLIGRSLDGFVTAETRHGFRAFLKRVFTGETEESCQVSIARKGQQLLHVHIYGKVLAGDCRAAMVDITEQKGLERQLVQAQKMESLGLFVGGVAHDFNNLLTAICGYGEAIREGLSEEDTETAENLAAILQAAERAVDLTRGLLTFGRREESHPQPARLDDIVTGTEKLIRKVIGEHIRVECTFSATNLTVMADSGQISQVLMNLAANARDAMPNGGTFSISVKERALDQDSATQHDLAPGRYARISVSDTGTGMTEAEVSRIFEPFFTTKEVGKGTGLGLAIVYGIIRQHNGAVTVDSRLGKGTRFDIYLPLTRADISVGSDVPAAASGTETVLVVEDEEMVRNFIQKVLTRAGYRVLAAENGGNALRLFRQNDGISLLISDVLMPEKSGIELQQEIVQLRPAVKTLFISGYTGDVINGKMLKGTEFLTKPFHKNELLGKVRKILDAA
jgi:signal transduction histidine kinase